MIKEIISDDSIRVTVPVKSVVEYYESLGRGNQLPPSRLYAKPVPDIPLWDHIDIDPKSINYVTLDWLDTNLIATIKLIQGYSKNKEAFKVSDIEHLYRYLELTNNSGKLLKTKAGYLFLPEKSLNKYEASEYYFESTLVNEEDEKDAFVISTDAKRDLLKV